jgi:dihydroxyacid dehydratase/phosphogluconate dehydratase
MTNKTMLRRADAAVTVRGNCPELEIISQDEMCDLIQAEAALAGSINQLCRNLRMASAAPVYLAMQKDRDVSDRVALHFGFRRVIMYERVGYVARR